MFQKRRSMLGRRHLMAQQQAQARLVQADSGGSGRGCSSSSSSWRGQRSGKKKTPNHLDKSSKELKKCLFSKSPGFSYTNLYRMQSQNLYSSNENLNETGISMMAPTPRSTPRNAVTPASLHKLRVEMEKTRYGPLPKTTRLTTKTLLDSDKTDSSSSSVVPAQMSYSSSDLYSLKRPDSPGPSRLERILLEERLAQVSSSHDFHNLKPPDSPPPSRLDKLIMEERLEQPLDPDSKKMQMLSLDEPHPRLQFSPPLSSTYIGSPDSGKKNAKLKEEIKATVLGSGRKLSTIVEDIPSCDVSVIEFELNERTMQDFDDTLMETTLNNTVRPISVSVLENIADDQINKRSKESVLSFENLISRLDSMEQALMDRAVNHANEVKSLKEQIEIIQKKIETIQKKTEKESLEDISNIRLLRKTLESLKQTASDLPSNENKENSFTFKAPTCKKKQLDEESKWFNSVKKENPSLLKTPNPNRKKSLSASLTPHSLSNVLHDQMNKLYN